MFKLYVFVKEKLDASLEEQHKENISGKITEDRFATLFLNYEKEPKDLKEKINELSTTIDKIYVYEKTKLKVKKINSIAFKLYCNY